MLVSFIIGRGDKVHISLDGEYFITVDTAFMCDCGVAQNRDIDGAELAAFIEAAKFRSAFLGAMRLLSARDYGKKELIRKLCEKGHGQEFAAAAADKAETLGYIDDERYAANMLTSLCDVKGYSLERAKYELVSRGIDRETVWLAAEGLDNNTVLCIINLLKGKFAGKLNDEKQRRRTVSALQRLGYRYGDIKTAFNELSISAEEEDS